MNCHTHISTRYSKSYYSRAYLGNASRVKKFTKSQEKINHIMFINDIKVFFKNEEEIEKLYIFFF